ncbi:hypothetical protein L198_02511 [Cryptococcus wingfieldii CBS 7118]|uniref:Uncharacterized protein n=1 Tax=Cryptococcus wingfieldii CBS 7118 TaxID=1295528 RepID=A0A1E3JS14_9TREE|nr:hypothetical protein L198_02511 [Cryptococcus wingfieldii CBS 7118]ODO03660.1 hypothetical protein L198_02511 [Cryptococcus wingfieldii CBS 7118]
MPDRAQGSRGSRPPTMRENSNSLYSAYSPNWDTPRASVLFYNPPQPSQPNTPLYDDAPPVPPLPPPLPTPPALPPKDATVRDSIPLSGYTGSPDRTDFLAHLPEEIRGGGVYQGDLDAKVLAELLSPRKSSSIKSKSSRTRTKSRTRQTDTPPPLPPKPAPPTPSTSVYASSIAYSDTSVTTETPVQPRTAIRGRRETVSQAHAHLLNPSLASLVHLSQTHDAAGGDGAGVGGLGAALANLPWAEPPPRLPTPLQSPTTPITPSPLLPSPSPGLTPSYAFLASDPLPSSSLPHSHSRKPSTSSSFRSRPDSRLGPSDVPMSPSLGHASASASFAAHGFRDGYGEGNRLSNGSGYSGMADTWEGGGVTPYVDIPAEYLTSDWVDHPDPDADSHSGAATLGSSSHHPPSKTRFSIDPSSSGHSHTPRSFSLSRTKSSRSTRSTRSTKSTKSTRSYYNTRRASTSTLGHVFAKRWEVRRYDDLERERGLRSAPLDGGRVGPGGRSGRQGEGEGEWDGHGGEGGEGGGEEEWMDLGSLVGRAVVLEKMLRGGKRLSNQSKKGSYRLSRFTSSSTPSAHRPSISLSSQAQAQSTCHHLDLPPPLPSKSVSRSPMGMNGSNTPRSSFTASIPASIPASGTGRRSKHSSTTPSTTSASALAAKRRTLRDRLSRRLKRSKSREDTFTELGSSGDEGAGGEQKDEDEEGEGEEEDPGMFPDQLDAGDGDRPPRPVSKGAWRMSRRFSRLATVTAGGATPREAREKEAKDGHVQNVCKEKEAKGKDRIGGPGVLVFPEELSPTPTPPPAPAKDLHLISISTSNLPNASKKNKQGTGKHGKALRIPHCLTPTSPTPLLSDMEKGLGGEQDGPSANSNSSRGLVQGDDPASAPASAAADAAQVEPEKYHQSPHLGHRSPTWRHRQSILSTLSTGPAWTPVLSWREWWTAQGGSKGKRKRRFLMLGAVGAVVLVGVVGGVAGGVAGRGDGD